jgi:hypothetical protein
MRFLGVFILVSLLVTLLGPGMPFDMPSDADDATWTRSSDWLSGSGPWLVGLLVAALVEKVIRRLKREDAIRRVGG